MTLRFGFPKHLFSSDPDDPNAKSRLRVDVGQTGFFKGTEFRMFDEFTLANGASKVYEFDLTQVEVILQGIQLQLWEGAVRFEVQSEGGTVGGTFGTTILQRRTNRMSTADLAYLSPIVIKTGGTYSGGVVTLASEWDAGNGGIKDTKLTEDASPYGIPKAKYYMKITASTAARGALQVRWEERP